MGWLDRYSERGLTDLLAASPIVRRAQAGVPVDVVALLVALATVESARDPRAQGDKDGAGVTHAWGLWQINSRVWPVDTGKVLGDVNYQIELAVKVLDQAAGAVMRGLAAVGERKRAGKTVTYTPDRDLPNLFNLAWQYGAGAVGSFMAESADLSAAGFVAWRASKGKTVHPGYDARVTSFRGVYDSVRKYSPSFVSDVVVQTGADVGTIGSTGSLDGTALGQVVDEKKEQVGAALDDLKGKLPALPDPGAWFAEVKGKLLTFALVALVVVLALVAVYVYVTVRVWRFAASEVRRRDVEVSAPGGTTVKAIGKDK